MTKQLERLSRFIPLSENNQFLPERYGFILSTFAANPQVPVFEKLKSILDESITTKEIGQVINSILEHIDTTYIINEFEVKKRTVAQKKRPNPIKSRIAKMTWKKNKGNMTRGLRKFHSSSKGKAFHKALGKFVSKSSTKNEVEDDLDTLMLELNELRISISSAITNLFIELKQNPETYQDFSDEEFNTLIDVYSAVMKDIQDAWRSQDPERIEDTIDEVTAEFASVLIGTEMDFVYLDDGLTQTEE